MRIQSRPVVLFLCVIAMLAGICASVQAAPPAPIGLLAQQSNNLVTVNWNAVAGADSYNVYRGTSPGGESATAIANTANIVYQDFGATNGPTYYYKIQAVFGTVKGALSAEVSAKPGTPQLVPPLLTAMPGASSVKLSWSSIAGATLYAIYRYDIALGWVQLTKLAGNTVTDAGRTNGVTYMYAVASINSNGAGGESDHITACAGDTPVAAPSGIFVISSPATDIGLNWNPVPGAIQYVVYRSATLAGLTTTPYMFSSTPYFNDSVSSGSTFYYEVAAINASGLGLASGSVSGTANVARLAAPPLSGQSGGSGLQLNWFAVTGATSYDIFRSIGDQSHYILYKTVSSSTLGYLDTAVVTGTTYNYQVTAVTTAGIGFASVVSVKAGALQAAGPNGINAIGSSNHIALNWNPVAGVPTYNIYRGTAAGAEKLLVYNAPGGSYTDSAVTSGVRYYYKVRSLSNQTEGGVSAEVSATPAGLVLQAPTIDARVVPSQITLHVGIVPSAVNFNIYRAPLGGSFQLLKMGFGIPNGSVYAIYTDTTAAANTTYTYYACGVCSDGQGLASNQVDATSGNVAISAPSLSRAYASSNRIDVYAQTVPSAISYAIYRGTVSGSPPGIAYAFSQTSHYQDFGATPGTTYYYWVTAYDYDGESGYSPQCSATAGVGPLSAAILTATQASSSVVLRWSSVSGATAYNIFRGDIFGGTYNQLAQNVGGNSYNDSTVTVGIPYFYYIEAIDVNGSGSDSNTVSGVAGSTALATPFGIAASPDNTSAISITFSPVVGAASYNLYRSTSAGGEGLVPVAVGITTTLYHDLSLTAGVRYYYKVTAVDLHGQSVQTAETSATPGSTRLSAPTLSVVPAGSTLVLTWSAVAGAASYTVYRSLAGQLQQANTFLKQGVTGLTLTDSGLVAGANYTYWVTAVKSDGEGIASDRKTAHT
jgi:fibronectin type 3 domain-containing protein